MPYLYLTYHEEVSGGEFCEGEPEDDCSYREDTFVTFEPDKCLAEPVKNSYNVQRVEVNFEPIIGKPVNVVYVRYSTGGTFGRTLGAWEIIGIYNNLQEADEVEQSIRDDTYPGHCCWKGWFDSLESCEHRLMWIV